MGRLAADHREVPATGEPQTRGGRTALSLIFVLISLAVLLAVHREPNFFLRDDLQNYFLGGYAEIVRALKAGEAPLLTSLSWQCGALAGEYQFGVFSPVVTALNLLLFSLGISLPYIGMSLVWVNSLILSSGTYYLARSKNLSPQLSLMAALVTSLNGWMITWGVNWIPALSSFALVPWAWLALRRTVARRGDPRSVLWAGILVALIFTSGWPYSCLMIMLIAAQSAGNLLSQKKPPRTALPIFWSMLLGLGLSAPAWLMLIEYSRSTVRALTQSPLTLQTEFMLPSKAYLATILPSLKAYWNVPWNLGTQIVSSDMHIGLAPVIILATAFLTLRVRLFRELTYDWLFLLILLLLASLPSLGMFRWSFRWLPLLFLQTALVAGQADRLLRRTTSAQPRYGAMAFLLVSVVSTYSIFIDLDRSQRNLSICGSFAVLSLIWWKVEATHSLSRWHRHLPWMAVFLTSMLVGTIVFRGVPGSPRQHEAWEAEVFDPSITYLALYSKKHYWAVSIRVFGPRFYPGNENMHSNLSFVNGYSPMGPTGTTRTFGLNYIGAIDRKPPRLIGPILQRMAVDGLVVWPDTSNLDLFPLDEFERVASTPDFDVYHRASAPTPPVQLIQEALLTHRSETILGPQRSKWPVIETSKQSQAETVKFGTAELQVIANERLSVAVDVDAGAARRAVLISFARPWFPGYRAYIDGAPAEVVRLDRMMPAVIVPAGQTSRVVLRYRPWSLVVGFMICGLTLAASSSALLIDLRKGRHSQGERA